MASLRVVVIGTGPAGMRAAETLVAAGVRPIVIDEYVRDGGQIYRRQPSNFRRTHRTLYGSEAERAASLHVTFERIRDKIDYRPQSLAWNIYDGALHYVESGLSKAIASDALIIASGATDRLMPVRGWNGAGVYSLGAAQIALKSQACAVGRRVAFLGTGPLLYLVASQYRKAGAGIAAVLDLSPPVRRLSALKNLCARPTTLLKGLKLIADLRRHGVAIERGVTPLEIVAHPERGVEGLRVRTAAGLERGIDCDAVALGCHLRPETQLADLARCEFRFDAATHHWLPTTDSDCRSSVRGIYLAGDGVRLVGADGAEAMGALAALTALSDLGRPIDHNRAARLRRVVAKMERFQRGVAEAFPWPAHLARDLSDDTVVCRCETITAGEIRAVCRRDGIHEANRVKAFSRVGMGRCQGRYCGSAAAEVIAAAAGVPVERVGRLRGQAPVKPLAISVERVVA